MTSVNGPISPYLMSTYLLIFCFGELNAEPRARMQVGAPPLSHAPTPSCVLNFTPFHTFQSQPWVPVRKRAPRAVEAILQRAKTSAGVCGAKSSPSPPAAPWDLATELLRMPQHLGILGLTSLLEGASALEN